MLDTTKQVQLQELLEKSQSVLVLFGKNPSTDHLAAALGLAESLRDAGKAVTLASPEKPHTKLPLLGLESVTTELGNQNLLISFEYSQEAVDKVSYNISDDNTRFHLTVKPRKGSAPLDAKSVEVGYSGVEADLVFVVGVSELSQLEALYSGNEELYQNTPVVVVGERSAQYGTLQLTLVDEVGVSQLIAGSLLDVGVRPNAVAATNLLAGIESTTGNLQSTKTTAETFEVIARLMRAGAERLKQASGGTAFSGKDLNTREQHTIEVTKKKK